MQVRSYKIIFIFVGLFGFFTSQQAQGQEKKSLSFNDIMVKLTFTSRISKSTEEINKQLITDIQRRKVNFILASDDEDSLKKAGGNDALVKTIRENLPKEIEAKLKKLDEQAILYKKFTDNYNGTVEQKRIAIEAGKEFLKKYGDDKNVKDIITYIKNTIPALEIEK